VLVVDDQPGVCDSLAAMVSALGHSVAKALDGATALDQVIARRFDVVITDLAMPGMNGLELARGVRACRPSTGVVLLTAWDAELGGDASVSDVLVVSKPVTMDGLRECLAAAAERRPGSGGLHLVYSSEAGS
jgi:CheY-like chemotaxis protein